MADFKYLLIRLPQEEFDRLHEIAAAFDLSATQVVRGVFQAWLRKYEEEEAA